MKFYIETKNNGFKINTFITIYIDLPNVRGTLDTYFTADMLSIVSTDFFLLLL